MRDCFIYHIAAFFAGFLLDLLLGDPHWMPHPVRMIGRLVSGLETALRRRQREAGEELFRGLCLVIGVLVCTAAETAAILILAYRAHPLAGVAAETVMIYQLLAVKCLKEESMKVCHCLRAEDLEGARYAVSMIVGRDTDCLDEEGIIKAAVETVAENTSDGVVAPMLYAALGGPVLGFLYKAVNTMDSMVGYRDEKYLYFGRAAARLDNLMNWIPARISAWLMIVSAFAGGRAFSGKGAFLVWRRDRRKHASPNSAQTEAACAGALGIRLAGNASYAGKVVEKPCIGREGRRAQTEDICLVNRLLYMTAWSAELLCLLFMLAVWRMG